MPTVHDYAACSIEICLACDSFSDGWTAGKAKAYAEIRAVPASGHSSDCGCQPCSAVRDSIRAMIGLDQGGLTPKYARLFAD